jgi:hypothetical protein
MLFEPISQKSNYLVFPGLLLIAATSYCINLLSKVLLPTLLLPRKINYLDGEGRGTTASILFRLQSACVRLYLIIDFE